jgi:asparagine synthase (glutamine-hydrolysing)
MCGIAGIVGPGAASHRSRVQRMVDALHHRGPDAAGVLEYPEAILGHARLSIVDLAGGAQPMAAATDSQVAVTFNGEIYGYRELRDGLRDYPFRTQSDTELLPALYRRDGDEFVEKLPGMFAFGLWDGTRRQLLLARDRFGEKPLYYADYEVDGKRGIVFASEIKAILASGLVRPRVNRDAIAHYLQYLYVHPRQTIYENVHTLPPGHLALYRPGSAVTVQPYWVLPETIGEITAEDASRRLQSLLETAVARQLVADVPVGAFLSGGLDSSTIVAVAAGLKKRGGGRLDTFSFRFRGATGEADEIGYANTVAAMHGTEHHILEDTDADIAGLLQEMAHVYDEPFADSSNIATYLIARLARRHMKVVLTGDGGDELLAGYPWYRELFDASPPPSSMAAARAGQNRYFSDDTLHKFGLLPSQMTKRIERTNTLDDALRMDLLDYMPGDILVKIDRASMAHGLELRAPFLDVELASFLIALPLRYKMDPGGDKLILRQAFGHLWPERVRARGKQGFGAPVSEWLARPQVRRLVETRLNDPQHPLFALLPFATTRVAVERRNTQTWILLTLALWLERHPA